MPDKPHAMSATLPGTKRDAIADADTKNLSYASAHAAEPVIVGAFSIIAGLAAALGVKRIDRLPACWELAVDEKWWIALNGHLKPTECSHGGPALAPLHCYIEYNGWPAGVISPGGGVIAAGGGANEDTFIAALQDATKRAAAITEGTAKTPRGSTDVPLGHDDATK